MPKPSKLRQVPCSACGQKVERVNGEWLRWKREQTGQTLRKFAAFVNLSAPYISDIERNLRFCPEPVREAYERL